MSETIAKLRKRRIVDVPLGNNETVYVKPLPIAEWKSIAENPNADELLIAMTLVEKDGTPVFPRGEMSLEDYTTHAVDVLKDVDLYVRTEICRAAATPPPPVKAIVKN